MSAQIFISCGQRPEELACANDVKARIESIQGRTFKCFLALRGQTLAGVKEHVFKRLREVDYFVFIDFKRERLDSRGPNRGSLWANQELAIASFVDSDENVILFQEQGVQKCDGLLGVLSGATTSFSRRADLPATVARAIEEKCNAGEWSDQTRNRLELDVFPQPQDRPDGKNPDLLYYPCHITVANHHHRKAALNCCAYLESVKDPASGREISSSWETAEFKWAGTQLAGVRIASRKRRLFDAAWFPHNRKTGALELMYFAVASTTDRYPYRIEKPGRYLLKFRVGSDTFPDAHREFLLEFGTSRASVSFEPVGESQTGD